jgi:hypothetical protein
VSSGGGLSGIDVANDDEVDVSLFFTHVCRGVLVFFFF